MPCPESQVPQVGFVPFGKNLQGDSLTLLCEDTRTGFLADIKSAGVLMSGFPASRTENSTQILLLISPGPSGPATPGVENINSNTLCGVRCSL